MLDNCASKEERWQGVQALIQRWLAERQELIVIYCALSNLKDNSESRLARRKLELFCEVLVDYVSSGHFEVYDQLAKEAEAFDDDSARKLFHHHYAAINETTEAALRFNDMFDLADSNSAALDALRDELSELGEQLSTRFQLEDELIDALHNAHAALLPS
ncbi:MAG TPA: sigma D regulator [Pseudomonadales bacterium]